MFDSERDCCICGYLVVDGKIFDIKKERTTIGRSKKCMLTLCEPTASKFHAVIYSVADFFFIKDCCSSNGFFFLPHNCYNDLKELT
jgi:hypothetical protein